MCDPVSAFAAATATVEIGKTVAGAFAQHKEHKAVVNAANQADTQEQNQLSERGAQEDLAAQHDLKLSSNQAMYAESMARLSAMEAGVTGNSAAGVVGNVEAGRSAYDTSVKENLDMEHQQLMMERLGADARRNARINGAPDVNPWITGLSIAGSGVEAYGDWYTRTHPPK